MLANKSLSWKKSVLFMAKNYTYSSYQRADWCVRIFCGYKGSLQEEIAITLCREIAITLCRDWRTTASVWLTKISRISKSNLWLTAPQCQPNHNTTSSCFLENFWEWWFHHLPWSVHFNVNCVTCKCILNPYPVQNV